MNNKYKRCAAFVVIILLISPLKNGLSEGVNKGSLSSLVSEANQNNPEIQAARKAYLASEELFRQTAALDDPRLTAGYFFENVETRVGPQIGKLGISQKFPFFGKLTLKGKIALRKRDIAYQNYLSVRQDVIRDLKHAFFELYWIRKATDITNEIKGLVSEMEKVAESKYSTGIASQQDILKAQVEISSLMAKLYKLSEQETMLRENINTLLNKPAETPLGVIADFPLTGFDHKAEELIALAEKHRPEMKTASLNVEKNENMVSFKKKDYFPDFTIGVDYIDIGSGHSNSNNDGQDAWLAMVSINLPIWRGRIKAGVDEAKNKLASSRDTYQNVSNSVEFQIRDGLFKLKTAKDMVDLYKDAFIPQADESLKASRAGYETGKTDFLNLIDSERVLLNFKIAYYRSVADYENSVADLERAVGISGEDLNQ